MKKYLIVTLAMFVLGSYGVVLAQESDELDAVGHEVTILIPEVAFLRFTDTVASRGVYSGATLDLEFDLDPADVEAIPPVPIVRTNTDATWGDLKVFVNRAIDWTVTVTVVPAEGTPSFSWSKIGNGVFNIDGGIAGTGTTNGWHSLGFGATDLRLTLDGSELAGTYVATVTYTLTTP